MGTFSLRSPFISQKGRIAKALLRHLYYIVEERSGPISQHLGEFEQLILLALVRLRDQAYGVSIRNLIEERTGRDVAVGAVYTTLDRLEKKAYVTSRLGSPSGRRGGRRKKFYDLAPPGERALANSFDTLRKMVKGLDQEELKWL